MSNIEIFAALCGFAAVALTIARSVWCWPIGLVQVLLYIFVFYDAKLYSDMLLHVVFVFLQFYGWSKWRRNPAERQSSAIESLNVEELHAEELQVERLSSRDWFFALLLCGALTGAIGWTMSRYTDAAWPFADALIAGTSLVAQWLLARRQLQNWYLWIVIDIVAIVIFYSKELIPTAVLYGLFLVMSIVGAIVWTRKAQR